MTERYDRGYPQALARIEELEAKLERAMLALANIDVVTCHNMPLTAREEQAINREARQALSELKGQGDE